jgi:NADH-quinone oxidoreductase subunit N
LFAVTDEAVRSSARAALADKAEAARPASQRAAGNLAPLQGLLGKLVALLAMLTCTLGNLAAYGQTNIKRLLAYSTIAHAGYMMMAIPPVMALAVVSPDLAERAVAGLAIYIAVYLFMNLGAFSVVAFLRNAMHSEQIDDYAGLFRHCPGVVICLSLMLFSLLGIPPLAGFVGKFAVFASLVEGYRATGQGYLLLLFLVGGINTAISLFYYLRVVKVMTMDPDSPTRGPVRLPLVSLPGFYLVAVTLPSVVLFFAWEFLNQYALHAAQQLLG